VKLSPGAKKVWHLALVGFATGALAYISGLVVGAPFPGWRALVLGILTAGITRMSGALLAKVETVRPPPVDEEHVP
jgi:VIT1/CCC1 family predicted Fe2+/Mn2+ transporter